MSGFISWDDNNLKMSCLAVIMIDIRQTAGSRWCRILERAAWSRLAGCYSETEKQLWTSDRLAESLEKQQRKQLPHQGNRSDGKKYPSQTVMTK